MWKIVTLGILIGFAIVALGWLAIKYYSDMKAYRAAYDGEVRKTSAYIIKVNDLEEKVRETGVWVFAKETALRLTEIERDRLKALNLKHVKTIGSLELTVAALQEDLILN